MTLLLTVASANKVPTNKPWRTLTDAQRKVILYGTGNQKYPIVYKSSSGDSRTYSTNWEGVVNIVQRRYEQTTSDYMREKYQRLMSERPCHTCKGKRLRPEALAVTIGDVSIYDVGQMTVLKLRDWIQSLLGTVSAVNTANSNGHGSILNEREQAIAYQIFKETVVAGGVPGRCWSGLLIHVPLVRLTEWR